MNRGAWHALGMVEYTAALAIQQRVAAERRACQRPDTLLLLAHPPTITLGRRAGDADVLWDAPRLARAGMAVRRVVRGGRATCPRRGRRAGSPAGRPRPAGPAVPRLVPQR